MIVYAIPIISQLETVMRHVLNWFHSNLGLTWAWSIVATTIVVRMLLVPLTIKQIHSMQNLQKHAPQMKEIQKKYKHDRQKQNEELMKFYRENKINPAASCLPMLVQIPIFFALYFVLKNFEKTVLKDYPGSDLGWLHLVPNITDNITAHWSGYLLIAIYAGSQVASTYFMSTTMDKTQRILFMVLPLGFVFFIVSGSVVFPAGLLLYWVTTNLWTVGQGLVTRRLVPRNVTATEKRSSRTPPGGARGSQAPAPATAQAAASPAARTAATIFL
jgi:YidC/Oxa1 family membrane protein insertase